MTREEAQALAEREVLEYARKGKLRELAQRAGKTELEYAMGTIVGALGGITEGMLSGDLRTGSIESLAALCIELLRECHLRENNRRSGGAGN